jgi:thymidine phosphorylase
MLHLGGVAKTVEDGKDQSHGLIVSGKPLETFRKMIELQGGDARAVDDIRRLPQAQQTTVLNSAKSGYVASLQCEQVGTACVILGGGRERKEDCVDPAVGIVLHKKVGDPVSTGEALATIHYNEEARAARAMQLLESSFRIGDSRPEKRPLIHRVIAKTGEKQ